MVAGWASLLIAALWVLSLVGFILATRLYVQTKRVQKLQIKLDAAEQKYAAVLNFNESVFEGKSELIEMTLNHMNQGVAVIRPDGRFWLYNKRALEYTGVTEEELPFPPTARAVVQTQLRNGEFGLNGELLPPDVRAFLLEGKGRPPKSYSRSRPDGTVLEIRSDPMPDGSLIQTYTDITELARAKAAAEAAGQAKASFLATMSHEIRTPLSGVIGAARLLSRTDIGGDQRNFLETITLCSESLLVVINDILEYSRFESTGVSIEEAPCDPGQIIRAAFLVTKPEAVAKGLKFEIEGADSLPPGILTDGKRLRQALINYLGNSVKFTQSGSVTIRTEIRDGEAGRMLRFTVADTGIGIPPEAVDRLFREFSQVDGSITRRFGGSGLGLAITRRVAEALGGSVGLRSTLGQGSEFWIEIPLKEADLNTCELPERSLDAPARALRILVAEDVPTNQLIIGATLRSLGHHPVIVSNGKQALEQIEQQSFDIVMLDMQMPEIDGLEATRRIRAMGFHSRRLPIMAITANGFDSDKEACRVAGMDGFVAKPFDPMDVAREINRLTVSISNSTDAMHSNAGVNKLETTSAAQSAGNSGAQAA
ncbi:MAG: ATP-binding protein [Beijerinckiaceae bacterium]|nr:ATP-binding protein [Beijerinckiaceae bacterium]